MTNNELVEYRRILYLPRSIESGDAFACSVLKDTKIYFISDNNNSDIHIALSFEDSKFRVHSKVDNVWTCNSDYVINGLNCMVDPFDLKLKFNEGEICILIDNNLVCEIKSERDQLASIGYVDASGYLEDVFFGRSGDLIVNPTFYNSLDIAPNFNENPDQIIFDIGCHDGSDTSYYLSRGYSVLAVDANPILCARLAKTFNKEVAEGRLIVLNVGISKCSENLQFYINTRFSSWSSFDPDMGNRECMAKIVSVNTLPLTDLIKKYGVPYYIKIDIEGFDEIAVENLCDSDFRPYYISFEGGSIILIEKLISAGYNKFKIVPQENITDSVVEYTDYDGIKKTHRFKHGSSGPFGDDIKDGWIQKENIIEKVKYHFSSNKLKSHSWVDVHAVFTEYK